MSHWYDSELKKIKKILGDHNYFDKMHLYKSKTFIADVIPGLDSAGPVDDWDRTQVTGGLTGSYWGKKILEANFGLKFLLENNAFL